MSTPQKSISFKFDCCLIHIKLSSILPMIYPYITDKIVHCSIEFIFLPSLCISVMCVLNKDLLGWAFNSYQAILPRFLFTISLLSCYLRFGSFQPSLALNLEDWGLCCDFLRAKLGVFCINFCSLSLRLLRRVLGLSSTFDLS